MAYGEKNKTKKNKQTNKPPTCDGLKTLFPFIPFHFKKCRFQFIDNSKVICIWCMNQWPLWQIMNSSNMPFWELCHSQAQILPNFKTSGLIITVNGAAEKISKQMRLLACVSACMFNVYRSDRCDIWRLISTLPNFTTIFVSFLFFVLLK